MTIEIVSGIPMRGDLHIVRRDALTGEILSVWEKKNVITYGAGTSLVKLLAPNAAFGATAQVESQIKSMRFGTNNTAPQRSDVALASEAVVSGSAVRISLPDANRITGSGTVEFVAVLDGATGNGVTYREAGLFTRGDNDNPLLASGSTLFARQVFPDQPKTSVVQLEFRWRITFTV